MTQAQTTTSTPTALHQRFAAARTPAVATDVSEDGTLHLRFAGHGVISIHPATLDGAIIRQAILHGLKQKLVDAAAISRNPDTGATATVADKYNAVHEVFRRITGADGEASWNIVSRGTSGAAGGLLLRALCALKPEKDAATLRAWLEGKTAEEKTALRKNPAVAAMILTIQAEAAKKTGVDSDSLLDELDV